MAGQIPGMNELNQVSAKLQDITQQLDGITKASERSLGNLVPPKALNDAEKLQQRIEGISKVSKKWADSLGPLLRKNQELRELMVKQEKQFKLLDHTIVKLEKDLSELDKENKEQAKAWKDTSQALEDANHRFAELNKEMATTEEQFKATQIPGKALTKMIARDLVDGLAEMGKQISKLGLKLFTGTLNTLADAFMLVYKWQEQYVKSAGEFNQQLGPSTAGVAALRSQAFGLSAQFMAMGESWEYGIKEAEGFIKGIGFADQQTNAWMGTMVNFGRIMGMGGQEIGELSKAFRNMGMQMPQVTDNLNTISNAANAAGVDVASFAKDIASSRSDMASFGKQSKVFITAAGYARKLGVEVKTLVSVMKLTDTFEGAATAAAKLNTVFGTTINSMDLMLEDDPGKRLEMIRSGLIGAGKDAANLSRREVRLIGETLQMSEQEVEGYLKSGKTYAAFMKDKADEDAKAMQMDKMKQKLMGDTVKTLFSFQNAIRQFADMLKVALLPLTDALGITDPNQRQKGWFGFGKVMTGIFQSLAAGLGKIASNKNFQNFIANIGSTITQLFQTLDQYITKGDFAQDFNSFITGMAEMFKDIKWIVSQVAGIFTAMKSPFRWILEHIAGITEAFIGLSLAASLVGKAMGGWDLLKALRGLGGGAAGAGKGIPGLGGGAAGSPGGGITPPVSKPGMPELEAPTGRGKFGSGTPSFGSPMTPTGFNSPTVAGRSLGAAGVGTGFGAASVLGGAGIGLATGEVATKFITALGGAPKSVWGDAASGILGGVGQAIAGPAGAALMGVIGQSFGDLGSYLFGSVGSSGKGPSAIGLMGTWIKDAFKDMFRAGGGPVAAGNPYIVGEEGPEVFTPNVGGNITPNGAAAGLAQINIFLDGRIIQRSLWNPNNPAGVHAAAGA